MKRKMILGCVFAAACLLTAPLSADSLDDAAGRGDVAACACLLRRVPGTRVYSRR